MASLTSRGTRALHRSYRWLTATRSRRRLLLRSTLVVLLAPILLQWVLAYVLGGDARLLPPELAHARHLLLVTAHPDDECLFFAPSVLGVLDRDPDVQGGLLVLSTGEKQLYRPSQPPFPRSRADTPTTRQATIMALANGASGSLKGRARPSELDRRDARPWTTQISRTIPKYGGTPTPSSPS